MYQTWKINLSISQPPQISHPAPFPTQRPAVCQKWKWKWVNSSVISSLPEQINNFLRYTYSTIFFNFQQPACCLFSPRQLLLHLQSPRGSAWVQGGRRLPWKSWSKPAPEAKCAEGGACLGQLVDMEWTNFRLMFKNKEVYIVITYHITTSTKFPTYKVQRRIYRIWKLCPLCLLCLLYPLSPLSPLSP